MIIQIICFQESFLTFIPLPKTTEIEKNELLKLNPSNAGPWVLTLRSAAYAHKAFDHISVNPTSPTEPEALATFTFQHIFLGKLLASVPLDILNLLITSSDDPRPFDLLDDIKNHVNTDNSFDHKHLKLEAEQSIFEPGMTLDSYVKSHTKIRSRMIAAHYPDIKDSTTAVEFLINGLRLNLDTTLIGLQLLARAPADIKDFTHKFDCIKAYNTRNPAQPYHCTHPSYTFRSTLTVYLFKLRYIVHLDTRKLHGPRNSNGAAITFNKAFSIPHTPMRNAERQVALAK